MAMTKDEFHSACKRHGLTVTEFAEKVGVSPQTAYQWGARYGLPHWARLILELMDQYGADAILGRLSQARRSAQPAVLQRELI